MAKARSSLFQRIMATGLDLSKLYSPASRTRLLALRYDIIRLNGAYFKKGSDAVTLLTGNRLYGFNSALLSKVIITRSINFSVMLNRGIGHQLHVPIQTSATLIFSKALLSLTSRLKVLFSHILLEISDNFSLITEIAPIISEVPYAEKVTSE